MFFQRFQQCGVKILTGSVIPPADHHTLDARIGGAFQRVDAGFGGHDKPDLAAGVLAPGLAVQQRLQIGAAAGH